MKTYLLILSTGHTVFNCCFDARVAHHGTGISYDLSKLVSAKGVVVKYAWSNPTRNSTSMSKTTKGP